MIKDDLTYAKLQELLVKYSAKGRSESASFLNWFFENIYRLSVCAEIKLSDISVLA